MAAKPTVGTLTLEQGADLRAPRNLAASLCDDFGGILRLVKDFGQGPVSDGWIARLEQPLNTCSRGDSWCVFKAPWGSLSSWNLLQSSSTHRPGYQFLQDDGDNRLLSWPHDKQGHVQHPSNA